MNINTAIVKITDSLKAAEERIRALGLTTEKRSYFTDARFIESATLTPKTRLVFGELTATAEGLADGEEAIFAICAEIKAGEVEDAALLESITEFESEVDELCNEAGKTAPAEAIKKINERQEKEADEASREMEEALRKSKIRLTVAMVALIGIIAFILLIGYIL